MAKRKKSATKDKKPAKGRARGVRPFWSGTLSFGLVNVPVHLFPAQRSGRVTMRMLAPDGTPVERRYYCPEHDIDVQPEHLIRGFQVDNGEYVVVHEDELEALEPQKSREIDLRRFVDLDEIPPLYFERSYYLTPSGDSNKAYRLLASVMEQASLAGMATFVMRDKEYLVAILSENGILRAAILRLADEIRTASDVGLPEVEKVAAKNVKRFASLIESLSQDKLNDLDFDDRYTERVEKLVAKKAKAGRDVVKLDAAREEATEDDSGRPHVDLLETIRQSLATSNGK
jgi:DNA end-binding protein Ku